jgi:hypothetical protein
MADGDRPELASGESDTDETPKRRRFLQLASGASLGALAGCMQFGGSGGHAEVDAGRPEDWCVEENDVEVADVFVTAESIDGIQRDPDELNTREEAAYQCHPQGYQLCANCQFFIPAKPGETGHDEGACAIVEGQVRSRDWCALYQPTEDLEEYPAPETLSAEGQQKPPETN